MTDLMWLLGVLVWLLVGFEVIDRTHRDQVYRWAARGLAFAFLLVVLWPLSAPVVAWRRRQRRGATYLAERPRR